MPGIVVGSQLRVQGTRCRDDKDNSTEIPGGRCAVKAEADSFGMSC